jgi:hypothetical protein
LQDIPHHALPSPTLPAAFVDFSLLRGCADASSRTSRQEVELSFAPSETSAVPDERLLVKSKPRVNFQILSRNPRSM